MILSALNAALNDQGVRFGGAGRKARRDREDRGGGLLACGRRENGNILKLSIPQNDFEVEILNFKILE